MDQSDSLQRELQRGAEHAESVGDAAAKIDRRSLFEILRRTGHFPDAKAEMHALCEHLIVEDKIVGILEQGQLHQDLAAESAIASVIFGELHPQKQILEGGQQTVGNVFVKWHAPEQRPSADDARTEYNIVNVIGHHAAHRRDQQRRVLIIGVQHDDYVRAGRQRLAIARLLVAAIAVVAVMLKDLQAETVCQIDGAVGTVVVDQDADVDQVGQIGHRGFKSHLRVVGGHDDRDSFAVDHKTVAPGRYTGSLHQVVTPRA